MHYFHLIISWNVSSSDWRLPTLVECFHIFLKTSTKRWVIAEVHHQLCYFLRSSKNTAAFPEILGRHLWLQWPPTAFTSRFLTSSKRVLQCNFLVDSHSYHNSWAKNTWLCFGLFVTLAISMRLYVTLCVIYICLLLFLFVEEIRQSARAWSLFSSYLLAFWFWLYQPCARYPGRAGDFQWPSEG